MSMICELYIVPATIVRELRDDSSRIHDVLESHDGTDAALSLEKSWHGLHFVLTGSPWEGSPPLNILASGGVTVGDEDVGYGPARVLDSAGVAALHAALSGFTEFDFDRNFKPKDLAAADIYPQIWDEPIDQLKEEYGHYLQEMKSHVQRAAKSGQAMIVAIR